MKLHIIIFIFAVINNVHSRFIDCEFELIKNKAYQCRVTFFENDPQKAQDIKVVTGFHLQGFSNLNVTKISFDGIKINYFPKGIEKIFPNLNTIGISSAELLKITQDDLKPFGRKLKNLYLWNNTLTELKSETFAYNTNLRLLVLQYNQIKVVEQGALSRLKKLRTLNFGHNLCDSVGVYNNKDQVRHAVKEIEHFCRRRK